MAGVVEDVEGEDVVAESSVGVESGAERSQLLSRTLRCRTLHGHMADLLTIIGRLCEISR